MLDNSRINSLSIRIAFFIIALAAPLLLCAQTPPAPPPNEIAFLTDFGTQDDAVAICKQVMYNLDPTARIIDISHDVTPFSILDGARFLAGMSGYVPKGTVFIGVVDPGVGTSRKPIVAKSNAGNYYVVPDNGLLTNVQDQYGIESARVITNAKWLIQDVLSSTFHGRDIFSPVGAHIARGEDWTEVGPELPVSQLVRLPLVASRIENGTLHGQIIGTDGPFGNLITNVSRQEFESLGFKRGDTLHLTLGANEFDIPFVKTFGDVPVGSPLAFIDSRGRLSFSINRSNFAKTYNIKPPVNFIIPKKN